MMRLDDHDTDSIALRLALIAVEAGGLLPELGDPTVISHTTWAVLLVVTCGLLLSFTPVRR